MKFLNDGITINVSNLSVSAAGAYPYSVKDSKNNTLFVGNAFLQVGQTAASFDITDIAANQRWLPTQMLDMNASNVSVNMEDNYTVTLSIGNVSYSGSSDAAILAYRYPNEKTYLNKTPLFDVTTGNSIVLMLQGVNNKVPELIPTYPLIDSEQYKVMTVMEVPSVISGYSILTKMEGARYMRDYNTIWKPSTLIQYSLSTLYNEDEEQPISYIETDLYNMDYDDERGWYYSTEELTVNKQCIDMKFDESGWQNVAIEEITESETILSYSTTITASVLRALQYNGIRFGYSHGGPISNEAYICIEPTDFEHLEEGQMLTIEATFSNDDPQQGDFYISDISLEVMLPEDNETKLVVGDSGNVVAKFDTVCFADYYLQWQDRFGSIQSQPFKKLDLFSESFNREEVINYRARRRLSNVIIQPKWKISSDWINEHYYPYYESIFVSPYLRLYDVKEDKSYNVIINDNNYEEKTFKNQKKLFNLTLELEENRTQNILY